MASFLDFLTGSPPQTMQFQRFTPQQQGLQNQSIQQALGLLQGPQDYTKGFQPIAQQARSQFTQNTIPTLSERFTSLGSGSALSSPAFASQLGQAGAGLEQGLAALQSQYGLQQQGLQQNQLNSLLNFGMQPSFESLFMPQGQGFLQGLAPGIGAGLGNIGSLFALLKLLGGGK